MASFKSSKHISDFPDLLFLLPALDIRSASFFSKFISKF